MAIFTFAHGGAARDREKPGAKEGGGADLALLCPPRTAVTLDTSMGTEAEAIQSSPRFFLVSPFGGLVCSGCWKMGRRKGKGVVLGEPGCA